MPCHACSKSCSGPEACGVLSHVQRVVRVANALKGRTHGLAQVWPPLQSVAGVTRLGLTFQLLLVRTGWGDRPCGTSLQDSQRNAAEGPGSELLACRLMSCRHRQDRWTTSPAQTSPDKITDACPVWVLAGAHARTHAHAHIRIRAGEHQPAPWPGRCLSRKCRAQYDSVPVDNRLHLTNKMACECRAPAVPMP